jgi:hypothetical protein
VKFGAENVPIVTILLSSFSILQNVNNSFQHHMTIEFFIYNERNKFYRS